MTTSKTYLMPAGLNYVESSDILYTTIYVVKREGTQYDKYVSGSANRKYTYTASEGRIYFQTAASENGEKVFVLFKKTSFVPGPIPGVCDAVIINSSTLPDAVVDVPYSESFNLSGTAPFNLTINDTPSGLTPSITGSVFTLSGTPDTEGPANIDVDITNCEGAHSDSFAQSITVYGPTANFFVSNLATAGVAITKVIGLPRSILTGTFPIHYLSGVTGVHADYSGIVTVFVTGIMFPFNLLLYKNAVLLESIPVTTDDSYSFAEQDFLSTDQSVIIIQ